MWQVKAVFGVVMLGAYLGADYTVSNNARPEADRVSFVAYLGGWVNLATASAGSIPATATGLAAALPPAPAGWTRRDAAADDVVALLVPEARAVVVRGGDKPGEDVRKLAAVGGPREGVGLKVAAATYIRGADRVVVEILRHPDAAFADLDQTATKMQLQMWVLQDGAEKIGAVTGMPVWQARIVPGLGARMAIASVGGQVHLRAVYPEKMAPAEVVALLAGLDVAALNRDVVAPDAAITAAAGVAPVAEGGGIGGVVGRVTGLLFGTQAAHETTEQRKSREDELVAAAQSRNAAKAGALAAVQYGAIAEELGKTEMKAAPASRSGRTAARGGRQTEINVGIGDCGDRGGGKFCSVAKPSGD